MIHAGSDLFLRACYAPHMRGAFPVTAYTAEGGRKRGEGEGEGGTVPVVTQDIAGPLCFAGDVMVPAVSLPRLEPGDVVALHEAGGNTLSLSTAHCSRRRPPRISYGQANSDRPLFLSISSNRKKNTWRLEWEQNC